MTPAQALAPIPMATRAPSQATPTRAPTPPSLDIIPDGTAEGGGDEQCSGVDLLFVIDNSPSMSPNIENLVANFPAFIDGIQFDLEADQGYHVGITTTDEEFKQDGIDPECEFLGTLVEYSDAGYCGPYAQGANFMTEADDLESTFGCAADLGSGGSGKKIAAEAAMNAVGVTNSLPKGCNPGFIRDDAMLVVVIITDEEDNQEGDSLGDPEDWHAYFATRKGVETKVVVLSIVGGAPGA